MRSVTIADMIIGDGQPCQVIAEVGINHNGDLEIAKKLIDEAKKADCWAVKFQKRTVDVVYSAKELATPRDNPFGTTNGDLKRQLELDREEYREIDRYCKSLGILWFASCWDEPSVDFVEEFNPPCHKVASAMVTNLPFLEKLATRGRPVIMSTGMSTIDQIDKAVNVFSSVPLVLMHTVSTYPSENSECNLAVIQFLLDRYPNIPVGYSGHERGLSISLAARVMGACVLERHITLDRTMFGSDQSASLEAKGLELLVRDIRTVESAHGSVIKDVVSEREAVVAKKLRYWEIMR